MSSSNVLIELLEALAAAERVDPDALDYKLHDYIDPEVLVSLAAMDDASWEITFQVSDHQVSLSHDGRIRVDGRRYKYDEVAGK